MNRTITLLSIMLLIGMALHSQEIKVTEMKGSFSLGQENGFFVEIPDVDQRTVEKAWKKLMRKEGDSKPSSTKDEYFSDDAILEEITDNTIDVYAVFNEQGNDTRMIVFFDLGGAFLNSSRHKEMAESAKKMIKGFAVELVKEEYENKLKEEEKELSGLEKDMKRLERDKKKLEKDIEGWKKDIKKAEDDITQNDRDQVKTKEEIKQQEEAVEKAKKKIKEVR